MYKRSATNNYIPNVVGVVFSDVVGVVVAGFSVGVEGGTGDGVAIDVVIDGEGEGDEEGEEAFDEIGQSIEHAPSASDAPHLKCAERNEIRRSRVGKEGEARFGTGKRRCWTGQFAGHSGGRGVLC